MKHCCVWLHRRQRRAVSGLICALLLSSCIDDAYDFSKVGVEVALNPSVAIPIAEGTMSIAQLFPDDTTGNPIVKADENKLVHLYYKQTLATITYDDFVGKVEDQQQKVSLLPVPVNLPVGYPLKGNMDVNFPLSLTSPDQIIESVELEDGQLTLELLTNMVVSSNGALTISSDDITMGNGRRYEATLSPTIRKKTVWLNDAVIRTSSLNKVKFSLSFSLTKVDKRPVWDTVMLKFSLTKMKSKATVGYLGRKLYNLSMGKIDLNYGKKIFESEEALIEAPVVKLEFENGIDVPFEYRCSDISAYAKNQTYHISGFPEATFIRKGATIVPKEVKSFATFESTTNLITVLSRFPQYINFSGNVISNPKGEIVTNRVGRGDKIIIKGYMDLPMQVLLKNVVLCDTIKYNFYDIGNNKDIDIFKVMLTLYNGFPADFKLNAYMLDENKVAIDTLFKDYVNVKSSAVLNSIATSHTKTAVDVEFKQSRLLKIKRGRYLVLRALGTTAGASEGTKVKILSTNSLNVNVVGAAQFKLNNK